MKNNINMRYLVIIFFGLICLKSDAQKKVAYDSSSVQQRNFSASSIDEYKDDRDYRYDAYVSPAPTLWERFWRWVWSKYAAIMSTAGGRITMRVFYIAFAVAAVTFFVFKVMKMNRVSLFGRSGDEKPGYTVEEENIHGISFGEAIEKAVREGNYRLAVRLLYLQNLKLLADRNLVAWRPDKTNYDYVRELDKKELKQPFTLLTHIFEYAWYGNSPVGKDDFTTLKEQFISFQHQL